MRRNDFLKTITGLLLMTTIGDFKTFAQALPKQNTKMPVLFIGHGSPMNGIEINEFSNTWKQLGKEIATPRAVLCISAHWLTKGTHITAMENPRTIHDFGGFPETLYQVQYPAPGNPSLASEIQKLLKTVPTGLDHDWGLDHGCWTVVRNMFPDAHIPVLQLSIDFHKPTNYHYQLAKELNNLRTKGVLIIGSGNIVHNLGKIAWDKFSVPDYGFDWAIEFNETVKKNITEKKHSNLIGYQNLGVASKLAVPTPDHYLPLLYALALQENNEQVSFFNDNYIAGSLSMTSIKISS